MSQPGMEHRNSVLYKRISNLIDTAKAETATYVNAQITMLYWNIGQAINKDILKKNRADYGKEILVTLSQQLTQNYGKGYSSWTNCTGQWKSPVTMCQKKKVIKI